MHVLWIVPGSPGAALVLFVLVLCVFNTVHACAGAQGLEGCKLSGVLLTHLHMGHYLGLMQFGREAMDWKGLKVGKGHMWAF